MDAVGDRDWVAEMAFAAALIGVHLSRLAEDLVLFSSVEFGFVRLGDGFSTGSSISPALPPGFPSIAACASSYDNLAADFIMPRMKR